jgi:hypothetical protein
MGKTKRTLLISLAVFLLLLSGLRDAAACSCVWRGPFLSVAPLAEGVVRARVLGYHGRERGIDLAMDVDVLEVLTGSYSVGPLRVWGDNGMLCRPEVSQFPPGSEWILALNGPGSKPAYGGHGIALSACGTYWLEVKDGRVLGNLDDGRDRKAYRSVPLAEFRTRLAAALRPRPADPARRQVRFTGEVAAGQSFNRPFGPGLRFALEAAPAGWTVRVLDPSGTEDLSRLTPPLHFVPNPRIVESWHFVDQRKLDERDLRPPGMARKFIFSPAVGRTIDGPGSRRAPTPGEIDEIGRWGLGEMRIVEFRLEDGNSIDRARVAWMRFEVRLDWPEEQLPAGWETR